MLSTISELSRYVIVLGSGVEPLLPAYKTGALTVVLTEPIFLICFAIQSIDMFIFVGPGGFEPPIYSLRTIFVITHLNRSAVDKNKPTSC